MFWFSYTNTYWRATIFLWRVWLCIFTVVHLCMLLMKCVAVPFQRRLNWVSICIGEKAYSYEVCGFSFWNVWEYVSEYIPEINYILMKCLFLFFSIKSDLKNMHIYWRETLLLWSVWLFLTDTTFETDHILAKCVTLTFHAFYSILRFT